MPDARAFVLFAEMRTGSNHLEESLAGIEGVRTFGEAFNPVFLGAPDRDEMLGFDRAARDADPRALLDALVAAPGLAGFRFFHDHDPRVLGAILEDRRIAKVVLTRNPLDSFVSLAIAQRTGQWRLTNPRMARAAKMRFDGAAFDALVARQAAFRDRVARALQVNGQAAFRLRYEEIGDIDVLNGLAAFLGAPGRLAAVPGRLVRQNPGPVEDKVENPDEMRAHLAGLDPFALSRSADLEPARGPAVPTLMAAARSPLLALPVPGGPDGALRDWLTALDGEAPAEGMTQKALRPWMRRNGGFTTFAVLRHPLLRAYGAFREARAARGPEGRVLRRVLANRHGVDLDGPEPVAFLGFLGFLGAALDGRASLPVAPAWASQHALLAGMAQAVIPQRAIREGEAAAELARLAEGVGRPAPDYAPPDASELDGMVDEAIERACHDAYRRDFLTFGFRPWTRS